MESKTANLSKFFDPAAENRRCPPLLRNLPVADSPPVTLQRPHTGCIGDTPSKSNSSTVLPESLEDQTDEAGEHAPSDVGSLSVSTKGEGHDGHDQASGFSLEHPDSSSQRSLQSYNTNAATASESVDQVSPRPSSGSSNQSPPFRWGWREDDEINGAPPDYSNKQTAVGASRQNGRTSNDEAGSHPPKEACDAGIRDEKALGDKNPEGTQYNTRRPAIAGSDVPVTVKLAGSKEWDPESRRHQSIVDQRRKMSMTRWIVLVMSVLGGLVATMIMVVLLSKCKEKRNGRTIFLSYVLVIELAVLCGMIARNCSKVEVLIALNLGLVAGIFITSHIDVLLGFSS